MNALATDTYRVVLTGFCAEGEKLAANYIRGIVGVKVDADGFTIELGALSIAEHALFSAARRQRVQDSGHLQSVNATRRVIERAMHAHAAGRPLPEELHAAAAPTAPVATAKRVVVLVACVAGKRDEPTLAADLYTSPWFRKARAYAEQHGDTWRILSAKHGVVYPSVDTIEPYNETLAGARKSVRQSWGQGTADELLDTLNPELDRVVILAGANYREVIEPELRRAGFAVNVPMAGLGIGEQLQWLTEAAR